MRAQPRSPSIVDIFEAAWERCMDEGKTLIPNIETALDSFYLSGDLPMDLVETWKEAIQYCPRGYKDHIDSRVWCAYCGDIQSACCDDCSRWFDFNHDPDEYEKILSSRYCLSCCHKKQIEDIRWELAKLKHKFRREEEDLGTDFQGWYRDTLLWKIERTEEELFDLTGKSYDHPEEW